jgi:3-oxoacyl-[acyl-carrier protein] reductase
VPIVEYLAGLAREIPLGRVGKAQEFANIAVMLASDAGSYVTGTAINIDGGRSPVV